jgi:hypothetical protein
MFFPNISNIVDLYLYSKHYDTTIREFLEEEEKHRQSKFTPTDLIYQLNTYNLYNKTRQNFNINTSLGTLVDSYLNNSDVIALCLSYFPKLYNFVII